MRPVRASAIALALLLPVLAPTQTSAAPTSVDVRAVGSTGTFHELAPSRVLDTRTGNGAPAAQVGPGGVVDLQVTGRGGVPSTGVSSVVLNVTAVGATGAQTWVTVWPSTEAQPETSNLNLTSGEVRANLVTVAVGSDGAVKLRNANGSTHLLADVQGYYSDADGGLGGGYHPIAPYRSYDSREVDEPWFQDEAWRVSVWTPGMDVSRVSAVVVNLTAVSPTANGYLTAWDGVSDVPNVSNVNFVAGVDTPNLAVLPVDVFEGEPSVVVYNSHGTTDVLVDVLGWYDSSDLGDGYRFTPVTPARVLDTRNGTGGPLEWLSSWSSRPVPTQAVAPGAAAVVANVTGVAPTSATWIGVSPETAVPSASTLNLRAGETRPNLTTATTGASNDSFAVFNATGNVHVITDVFGYFS